MQPWSVDLKPVLAVGYSKVDRAATFAVIAIPAPRQIATHTYLGFDRAGRLRTREDLAAGVFGSGARGTRDSAVADALTTAA